MEELRIIRTDESNIHEFGMCAYNGEVLADHVISATRFKNIMNKLSK